MPRIGDSIVAYVESRKVSIRVNFPLAAVRFPTADSSMCQVAVVGPSWRRIDAEGGGIKMHSSLRFVWQPARSRVPRAPIECIAPRPNSELRNGRLREGAHHFIRQAIAEGIVMTLAESQKTADS
jgi:hypothetical protein